MDTPQPLQLELPECLEAALPEDVILERLEPAGLKPSGDSGMD